jgi:hypothetical protein
MNPLLPLLAVSEQLQADLVIAATVLFLVFATCGFILSASGQPNAGSIVAAEATSPVPARTWRSPLRAAIIAGLLCGLAVLAIAGF